MTVQPTPHPTTPHLAVLDVAGTTVDEGGAVYRVLADVVADAGHPASAADIRRWMGADKREALAALTGRDRIEDLHDAFVARLAAAYAATPPRPLPGVPGALAALRTTGTSVVLTTGFDRQVTDPLLASLPPEFTGELDGVVCAEEVGAGRPDPAMIHRAMALTAVTDPARVLAAGDTVLDVEAGRRAGAGWVVGVLTGGQTRDELTAAGPTHVVSGVAALPELVGAGREP
ncbi:MULTISPECIES: phosphonatase-like hydrolase [unclassified Pseudonocardia]|uniref:phosphonatase-like hydrolase n=1 Tax=unclassified Pseudonocardia TaxID=2619320 RepID=UPI0001FFDEE4|nr:phosphonatase-like hydrolase [Pseudonocardia sp. Ae707_Ps1]OLM18351.1 Phosphonoacetaldehyde hydrolase [Pseudonocardia sp. Ae707_Ps1]